MWALAIGLIMTVMCGSIFGDFCWSGLYDKFLFYPSTDMNPPVPITGAELQEFSFDEADGSKISCWYYKKPNDTGLLLVSHGNAGNISHRGELAKHLLSDTSCSVLLYDYRGYGKSVGNPSVKGI